MRPESEQLAQLRRYQALLAPGTGLRDGLERIVHGRTGALIVLGHSAVVDEVSSGGFQIDVEFTPTALRELSKLDGGIVLSSDLDRIISAGVQFVPDPGLPSQETGTRHRSADKLSQHTGIPVVTVSASMSTIALFLEGHRYPLARPEQIVARANQALAAMSSYRERLAAAATTLDALEIQDSVTVQDVVSVAQRLEMVQRLHAEIRDDVSALGTQGRLLAMQVRELSTGLDELAMLLTLDYRPAPTSQQVSDDGSAGQDSIGQNSIDDAGRSPDPDPTADETCSSEAGHPQTPPPFGIGGLAALDQDELMNLNAVAREMGFEGHEDLDRRVSPRGYRQLAKVPRLPPPVSQSLLEHFGSLQALMGATTGELCAVDAVDETRARAIHEALWRIVE